MTSIGGLSVRIVPWDDQPFIRAFEAARDQVRAEGLTINGPRAAERAEQVLRAAGYPAARIASSRTVEAAIAHTAHRPVRRDGVGASRRPLRPPSWMPGWREPLDLRR